MVINKKLFPTPLIMLLRHPNLDRRYYLQVLGKQITQCGLQTIHHSELIRPSRLPQLYNFFSALLARAPTTNGPLSATDPGPPPDSAEDTEEGFPPVESGYKGPRVDFPLTKDGLDTLLAAFKHKKVIIFLVSHSFVFRHTSKGSQI